MSKMKHRHHFQMNQIASEPQSDKEQGRDLQDQNQNDFDE